MKALRIAAVVLWTLTALQVIAGLVTLYLWAFEIVAVGENAGLALYTGPLLTGAGAAAATMGANDLSRRADEPAPGGGPFS